MDYGRQFIKQKFLEMLAWHYNRVLLNHIKEICMNLPRFRHFNRWKLYIQQILQLSNLLILLVTMLIVSTGCNQSADVPSPGNLGDFVLPTQAPTVEPSPVSTRVMPVEVLTPPPTPSLTPIPAEALGLVVEVLDGNTIAVVMDGDPGSRAYQVKYLGIESPSATNNSAWSTVAKETNTKLTKLKIVRLVRDETDFDADGYLLRHVYVDDSLVSILLLEQGLVSAAITPPNVGFETEIVAAEARARAARTGIWGASPPTPTASNNNPPAATRAASTPTTIATASTLTATVTVTTTVTATAASATLTPTAPLTTTEEAQPTTEATPTEELQGP